MATTTAPVNAGLDKLDPGYRYASIDDALWAASCLCGLSPEGATIYGTTDPALAFPESGEAYVVVVPDVVRTDGTRWAVPEGNQWYRVYTLLRHEDGR